MCNPVALRTFAMLRSHHLCIITVHFHQPQKEALSPFSSPSSCPASPRPWHHSSAMDLPIRGISFKWNHTACDLLGLASLTWPVSQVHPCCSTLQRFTPFFAEYCCIAWMSSHFIHSAADGHLEGFYLLATMNDNCCEHLGTSISLNIRFQFSWETLLNTDVMNPHQLFHKHFLGVSMIWFQNMGESQVWLKIIAHF